MPFVKGQSGNPGGRAKLTQDVIEAREIARQHGPAAIKRLVELTRNKSGQVAVAACKEILDRAYGKAPQPQTGEGGEGPVRIVVQTGIHRGEAA